MKRILAFTAAFIGLMVLSGQTAQKIGNRSDNNISLCQNLGSGSEECLDLDTDGVLEGKQFKADDNGSGGFITQNGAAQLATNGTEGRVVLNNGASTSDIIHQSGSLKIREFSNPGGTISLWTGPTGSVSERLRIGNDGGFDIGPGAVSGADFHNLDGGSLSIRSGHRLFLNNAANTVSGVQLDGDGDSFITGGRLSLGTTTASSALDVEDSSTSVHRIDINNTSATALADAAVRMQTASGGGDPIVQFAPGGGTEWSLGVDVAGSDRFTIGQADNLSTPRFQITTSGNIWIPTSGAQVWGTEGNLALASDASLFMQLGHDGAAATGERFSIYYGGNGGLGSGTELMRAADNVDGGSVELKIRTDGAASMSNANIYSGTYSPTCTKVQGTGACDATPGGEDWQFMRVGNMVTITGKVESTGHAASSLLGIRVGVPITVATNGACIGSVMMNEGTVNDPSMFRNVQATTSGTEPCNVRWNVQTTAAAIVSVIAMYDISQ